jgi:hypothetical protein
VYSCWNWKEWHWLCTAWGVIPVPPESCSQMSTSEIQHQQFKLFPTNLSTQVDQDAQQASTNQGMTQELRGSYNAECLQDSRMHSSISKALSQTRTDHLTMRLGLTLPYPNASSCLHLSTGLCINQWDTISLSVFRK